MANDWRGTDMDCSILLKLVASPSPSGSGVTSTWLTSCHKSFSASNPYSLHTTSDSSSMPVILMLVAVYLAFLPLVRIKRANFSVLSRVHTPFGFVNRSGLIPTILHSIA